MPAVSIPTTPMPRTGLVPTLCAICGTSGTTQELYSANFTPDALNPEVFSARRLPDRLHYRLVRSDPVAESELVAALYERSKVTYQDEVSYLQRTYGRYLKRALQHICSE